MYLKRITFILLILFFTIYAGLGWQKQNSGVTFNLYGVQFVDSLIGFAWGGADSSLIVKTTDGGLSWITSKLLSNKTGGNEFIAGIKFLNGKIGWAWSNFTLWRTVNSGASWTILSSDSTQISNVEFFDSANGYATGVNGSAQGLFRTFDGGKSWVLCHYGWGQVFYFLDLSNGWFEYGMCPNGANIFFSIYTSDGGKTWTDSTMPLISFSSSRKFGVKFSYDSCGVGIECWLWCHTALLRTTNSGTSWQQCDSIDSTFSEYLKQSDVRMEYLDYYGPVNSITNDGFGWIFLKYGYRSLRSTSDSGLTWTQQRLPDTTINSVFRLNGRLGWAVGDSGKIFCYRDTSLHIPVLQGCISKLPRSLQLSGISPNPVGSKAIISFQLPQDCKINLSIHNAAGQLIQTISQGYYKAGTYQIAWNAKGVSGKNLPPGVYFCAMKAMDDKTSPAEKVRMMIVR